MLCFRPVFVIALLLFALLATSMTYAGYLELKDETKYPRCEILAIADTEIIIQTRDRKVLVFPLADVEIFSANQDRKPHADDSDKDYARYKLSSLNVDFPLSGKIVHTDAPPVRISYTVNRLCPKEKYDPKAPKNKKSARTVEDVRRAGTKSLTDEPRGTGPKISNKDLQKTNLVPADKIRVPIVVMYLEYETATKQVYRVGYSSVSGFIPLVPPECILEREDFLFSPDRPIHSFEKTDETLGSRFFNPMEYSFELPYKLTRVNKKSANNSRSAQIRHIRVELWSFSRQGPDLVKEKSYISTPPEKDWWLYAKGN